MKTTKEFSDLARYEEVLRSTANREGECDEELAVLQLADQFDKEPERTHKSNVASARALAKRFKDVRAPEVSGQQLLFTGDTWLAIGEKKHVPYAEAGPDHGERWLALRDENLRRAIAAHKVETREMGRLIRTARQHDCLLCEAEQMLLGQ